MIALFGIQMSFIDPFLFVYCIVLS